MATVLYIVLFIFFIIFVLGGIVIIGEDEWF